MPYKDQLKVLHFPMGGINRSMAYQTQPPYTTPDAKNVRPKRINDKRLMGGERPGIGKYFGDDLGDEIWLMDTISSKEDSGFRVWSESFQFGTYPINTGDDPTDQWDDYLAELNRSAPITEWWFTGDIIYPLYASEDIYYWRRDVGVDVQGAMVYKPDLSIDGTKPYTIDLFILPWEGEYVGEFFLYARMDDTNYPDVTDEGVILRLTPESVSSTNGYDNAKGATLISYSGGTPTEHVGSSIISDWTKPIKMSLTINGNTATFYLNDQQAYSDTIDSHTGKRFGLGMNVIKAGASLIDGIRVSYYEDGGDVSEREVLCLSSGTKLYIADTDGLLAEVSGSGNSLSQKRMLSAERGSELFICDYSELKKSGSATVSTDELTDATVSDWAAEDIDDSTYGDGIIIYNGSSGVNDGYYKVFSATGGTLTISGDMGTGSCDYEIYRVPKVYDPSTNTISIWSATTGTLPLGYNTICTYRDRIVLGGLNGYAMSRSGDAYDWDYTPEDLDRDLLRPVAGTLGDAGEVPEPIIALVPQGDDYLVFGCKRSVWILRGDPAAGGTIDSVSGDSGIGFLSKTSWCVAPDSSVIFLSEQGIHYYLPGAGSAGIQSLSDIVPAEFFEINPDLFHIEMIFDIRYNGIHIYLTPRNATGPVSHWWLDWGTKGFWPTELQNDHSPTAVCRYNRHVLLGCQDGYVRYYNDNYEDDDGTEVDSYVYYGPIRIGGNMYLEGIIENLNASLARESGKVNFDIMTGRNAEEAFRASSKYSRELNPGFNRTYRPLVRGGDMFLKLSNVSGTEKQWSVEDIIINLRPSGKRRP